MNKGSTATSIARAKDSFKDDAKVQASVRKYQAGLRSYTLCQLNDAKANSKKKQNTALKAYLSGDAAARKG